MGLANADLTIEDEQLSLTYNSGTECQGATGRSSRTMETRINFICPPRRSLASGNSEGDSPQLVQQNSKCDTAIEFYTDLACDYQVHCEVATGDTVYSLTKLRRHQQNYHVAHKESGEPEFVLNICGPLVPADVPRSRVQSTRCLHQGGHQVSGTGAGAGQSLHGQERTPGDRLHRGRSPVATEDSSGRHRSSSLATSRRVSMQSIRLGKPEHVSTSDCQTVFKFPTVLACRDTTSDQIVEPDSCRIFHPGTQHYVDIHSLVARKPYRIEDPESKKGDRYFEIQPCGRVASCHGAICAVHTQSNKSISLGNLNDFMYDPTLDSVRLRYTNGDECNFKNKKRWSSKIYYTCDMDKEVGYPTIRETYDCLIIFDWRTSAFCPETEQNTLPFIAEWPEQSTLPFIDEWPEQSTLPFIDDITWSGEPDSPHDLPAKEVVGGVHWGMVFLSVLIIGTVITAITLYR